MRMQRLTHIALLATHLPLLAACGNSNEEENPKTPINEKTQFVQAEDGSSVDLLAIPQLVNVNQSALTESGSSDLLNHYDEKSANITTYTYTAESLASKLAPGTRFENGALFIDATSVEISRLPLNRLGRMNVSIPVEFSEIQTRHQEWKKCGRLGVERCRKWVDDGRSPINASIEIWVGADLVQKKAYSAQLLKPGTWNENWSAFPTVLGPLQALGEGDPLGFGSAMASTFIGGRELKKAWRSFTGAQTLERSFDLGSSREPAEVTVIVRREANNGTFLLRPFKVTVVQF